MWAYPWFSANLFTFDKEILNGELHFLSSAKMVFLYFNFQKRPSIVKRCSGNVQQIYRKTTMSKSDFNKVAKQLYWNHTPSWVFSCKSAVYFQNIFLQEHLWRAASEFNSMTKTYKEVYTWFILVHLEFYYL